MHFDRLELTGFTFEVKNLADGTLHKATDVAIIRQPSGWFVGFCIPSLSDLTDRALPLSFFQGQEGILREHAGPPYSTQHTYSRDFHLNQDKTAVQTRIMNLDIDINAVFSVSMFCNEELQKALGR